MRYDAELRHELMARTKKANGRVVGKTNAYIIAYRKAWLKIGQVASDAVASNPDALAAAILKQAAQYEGDLRNREDLSAAARACAWKDAAHVVDLFDNEALEAMAEDLRDRMNGH